MWVVITKLWSTPHRGVKFCLCEKTVLNIHQLNYSWVSADLYQSLCKPFRWCAVVFSVTNSVFYRLIGYILYYPRKAKLLPDSASPCLANHFKSLESAFKMPIFFAETLEAQRQTGRLKTVRESCRTLLGYSFS